MIALLWIIVVGMIAQVALSVAAPSAAPGIIVVQFTIQGGLLIALLKGRLQ